MEVEDSEDEDSYSMESVGEMDSQDQEDSTVESRVEDQTRIRQLYTELHYTRRDLDRAVYVIHRQEEIINELKARDLPPKKRPYLGAPDGGPSHP